MRKTINKKLLTVLAILFLGIFVMPPQTAIAQQTKLYVDPPEIIDEALVPDSTFTIDVKIENVPADPGAVGIEFHLYWDASILEGVSMVLPTGHFLEPPPEDVGNLWNLAHTVNPGNVYYAYTFLNINKDYLPKSGDGTVATIELKVKSVGSCVLDLRDSIVGTPAGEELSHEVGDGYFENIPSGPVEPAKLYVDPPEIVDPTLLPSESFPINVSIANATDVYSFEFKLGFDPNVLNATSVELGDFFPPSVVPLKEINNTVGYVLFSATLQSPETPKSGDGTLAVITFHVEDLGASTLELFDTSLADETGEPLSHSTADGHFNNISMAKLYVDPPEIIDEALVPDSTFTIDVKIENVPADPGAVGIEFQLYWDASILEGVSMVLPTGHFLTPDGDESNLWNVAHTVNSGNIAYAYTFLNLSKPYLPKSGDGVVATIELKVKSVGSCVLDLRDSIIGTPAGEELSHEVGDGYFENIPSGPVEPAKLYVDPPEIVDPTLLPSSTFPINVTIDDVEDLRICEFNLTYNTNIVSWVSITVNKVLGDTPSAEAVEAEEAGFVWIKLTYSAPKTTYSPIALVTILFHVDAMGSTPLDLHDTKLTDPLDQPIPHEAFDGFFSAAIRDVAVVNVVPSPNDVYKGRIVDINVTVANEGDVAETFDVKAYYDDTLIETITVTNLSSKENTTVTFNWNTAGVEASHNYTIRAEAVPVPFETDLLDNAFTDGSVRIRILGDINADGKVDILDMVEGSEAFGSYLGDPRWNPWADLNGDGTVNILDLIIVASNFGNTG
jgi:hypothetical protein